MTVETETISGQKVCKISGPLTIWESVAAWEQIKPLLHSKVKNAVRFDLSKIETCDCAGIQILCQIQMQVEKKHDKFEVTGLSDALATQLRHAGLEPRSFIQPAQEA